MKRRIGRVDNNQKEITAALRKAGASVLILSDIGKGCPDILVGISGKNLLVEIKNGDLCPSKQRLSDDERKFHDDWRGQVCIIKSVGEAVELLDFIKAITCL